MNEKELDEIKRTLQRIQRIASEPTDEDSLDGPAKAAAARLNGAAAGVTDRLAARLRSPMRMHPPRRLAAAVALAALAVIGAAGLAGWLLMKPGSEPHRRVEEAVTLKTEPQEHQTIQISGEASRITAEAEDLLAAGKVSEVRRRLTGAPVKSPEVALILARSYDPNYLRLIPNADAAADKHEAERWYRTWRDIAAEKGFVLEPDRFDRIIRAMH
jgi:hypothetical protein